MNYFNVSDEHCGNEMLMYDLIPCLIWSDGSLARRCTVGPVPTDLSNKLLIFITLLVITFTFSLKTR